MKYVRAILMVLTGLAVVWTSTTGNGSSGEVPVPVDEEPRAVAGADEQLPKGAVRRIKVKVEKTRYDEKLGVLSVAWSPDGKMVACRCSDNTARIFAMPSAKELHQLRLCPLELCGWDGGLYGIAPVTFSPDNKLLATAWPYSTTAKLWDTSTGNLLATLEGGRRFTFCVSFSPNGRVLAMTCRDGIRLWDVESKRQIRILDSREGVERQVVVHVGCIFTPDGRILITAPRWNEIRFWDWQSGEELGQIIAKEHPLTCLAVSPDGQVLATCNDGHGPSPSKVSVWDLATHQLVRELVGTRGAIPGIALSPNGFLLAASDASDNKVTLWNLYTGEELAKYVGHSMSVYEIAFAPDSRTLVSASKDGTLIFWKVPDIEAGGKETEPAKLAEFWDKLAGDDAKAAYQAIWDLRQTGEQATAFIKERVKPVPAIDAEKVKKLVAELDAPAFAARRKAAAELTKLGELAEPALRKALEGDPSAEMRKKVEGLLSRLRFPTYHGEVLRELRAVLVLERIGTAKARDVLDGLAKGATGAKLTRDAKAALERLNRRAAAK